MTIQARDLLNQGLKKCSCCQKIKPLINFHKSKARYDGYKEYCKDCRKIQAQARWLKIKDNPIEKSRRKIAKKQWVLENKDHRRKYHNDYCSNRYQNDISYKLTVSLRNRFNKFITGANKQSSVLQLLGCNLDFLKKHLESKFTKGMNWNNYGKWHIDHIKPCNAFNLIKITNQKICFHWSNLQPLWAEENCSKQNRY